MGYGNLKVKRVIPAKRKWYNWPENKQTGLLPWYVILRKIVFCPFLLLSMCLLYVSVVLMHGITEANKTIRVIR